MTTFKKNLLVLSLAAFGFLSILVISVLVFMNSLYYEINTMGLRNTAKTLMSVIGKEITEIFIENGERPAGIIYLPISQSDHYRLTLIAPSGYVLWDSRVTERIVNHIDREEIKAALEGREASARRNSITTSTKLLYYALPVFDSEGNSIGVFRLSVSVPGFATRIYSILYPFLVFTFIIAFVIFWASFAFSRSLSVSLGRLANIAQAGTPLLSNPDAKEKIAPEFRSLEKTIQAFIFELNFRLEKTKTETRRLEAILNGMSEAVLAMDANFKLHLVNPRARSFFQLTNLNLSSMSLLEATRSTELVEIASKALSADAALEKELTFHAGAEQYFQVLAAPLAGLDGSSGGGIVLVLQDITRLVKLERIRKDFVANVSHELRTPIQLIKGFSETLLDGAMEQNKNKKKIVQFIKIIHKNADVMENLTNDLLILADLENSGARDMEKLNVASVIEEAVFSVEPQANRKNIKIVVDCPENLKANLYGSFIIQALINLLDNGIKYSPAKSKIWVKAQKGNNELSLEVHDKGIGISPEHMDRLFERFYRVDRSRNRETGSTGLGLSIVRHIALLHKGNVEAESHAGEGSVFRIKLPQL
jgi:two-component system phosphate regulon sensor histidine kinase PhoR